MNGQPRSVPAVTLDEMIRQRRLPAPYFIKVDAQGAELDVLAGAGEAISQASLVLLETSFHSFFKDGPLFQQVVAWMAERGLVIYDLFGLSHRPLDVALAQIDAVFVPQSSPLRANSHFASMAQREALTEKLRRSQ